LAFIEKNAIFHLGAPTAVAGCLGFVPCDCLPTITFLSARNVNHGYQKDSRTNKFTILGVEPPVWQGAQTLEYLDIPLPQTI
jgi:hypothetical protein